LESRLQLDQPKVDHHKDNGSSGKEFKGPFNPGMYHPPPPEIGDGQMGLGVIKEAETVKADNRDSGIGQEVRQPPFLLSGSKMIF